VFSEESGESQAWWHTAIIPALRRPRQENHEFEVSQDSILKTLPQKQKQQTNENVENGWEGKRQEASDGAGGN
jgi:hypothetical protein